MVAFGKKLKESQIQEWQGYYINYKLMKKKVKQYVRQIEVADQNHHHVLKDFSRILDKQIERVVLFLLEQQGQLATRLSELRDQHDTLTQNLDGSNFSELLEAYREVGRDLLRLLFFVEMNAIGLRKILKKFDKRFGFKFTNYYVKTRANHPYSQLRQVIKQVGISAVVGTMTRNLAELHDHQGNYVSIYDQPTFVVSDPVIDSIKAAIDRLTNSTNFLEYMGKHALIMQEDLPSPSEDHARDDRYHFMSLLLNLANTFLYMVNTYIIVPTADNYTLSLGAAATVCGAVIGSMAVAQVFSSVYFSAWSNKSYMKPLLFSSVVLLVGNTLYALAYDLNSIYILIIGRLFCGLGSARAVNRRYISDCVPTKMRMKASAGFVSASALGMAFGPALACLFQTKFKIFKPLSLTKNSQNFPKMEINQISNLLFISLCILYVTQFVNSFSPVDHYLIDCGSVEPTTADANHRRFTGDSSESGSHFLSSSRTISRRDSNPDPNLAPVYHTARVFTRPAKYVFDIKDKGTHLIRLHFHRFNLSNFDNYSVGFHVLVNGFVLLYDFTAENMQNSRVKDYMIWVDDEKLVIKFVPSKKSSLGFVSAIEVISAPKDLIADVGQLVNSEKNEQVNGLIKNALETVYRVNVGGYKVTPFNDSLWRTWVPDDEFLKSSDWSKRAYFGGRIKYQMGGASREVGPDNVYSTARVITSVTDWVPKSNITWVFPVNEGYKYLVRLHFCDIASISLGMLYFNVYVNGNLAYENLDLSIATNYMLASPFYADFVVDGESSGVITISVGPSNMSMPHAVDAILNGVEIMKMNNSAGSLDGLVSAESVMKCRSNSNIGVLASLIAAMFLLLLAPVVLHKRRTAIKDSVAWSRLPVDVSDVNLKCNNQMNVL